MLKVDVIELKNIDLEKYDQYICFGDRYNFSSKQVKLNVDYKIINEKGSYFVVILANNIKVSPIITLSYVDNRTNTNIFTLDIDNGCHYIENSPFVIKARINNNDNKDNCYKIFQLLNNKE